MNRQEIFEECYRGRHTFWHHLAYMRMAKVLMLQSMLCAAEIKLDNKSLFDYGFGAGTFFKYCPKNSRLFGVEMDPQNVAAVREILVRQGRSGFQLEPIEIARWSEHPLIQRQYDVVVCSHVLEHLPQPVEFLQTIKRCLGEQGVFVGLVPLNERKALDVHLHTVDERKIREWAGASGLKVQYYCEGDPYLYWAQPLFTFHSGYQRMLARAYSLLVGASATFLQHHLWRKLSRPFAVITRSKPTQAGFVLSRQTS